MQLIRDLEERLAGDASPFKAALLREDIARLARVAEILARASDQASFARDALMVGWTPGDLRTAELAPALQALFAAIWAAEKDGADAGAVARAWAAFDRLRIDRLVGCLARVPRPE